MALDLEETYDRLDRYCYYRVGSREAAEDLTQEALTRFWEKGGGKDLGYLYTIARNLCIDESRKVRFLPLPEDIPGPEQEERMLTRLAVRDALETLPPEDRELLLLRYDSCLKIGTIADLLGLSRFAVYRRLNGAVSAFRDSLKKEGLL